MMFVANLALLICAAGLVQGAVNPTHERSIVSNILGDLSKTIAGVEKNARVAMAIANSTVETVKVAALNFTTSAIRKVVKDVLNSVQETGAQVTLAVDCLGVDNLLVDMTTSLAAISDDCVTKAVSGVTNVANDLLDITEEASQLLERGRNATYLCKDLDLPCFALELSPLPPRAIKLAVRAVSDLQYLQTQTPDILSAKALTCMALDTATYAGDVTPALTKLIYHCISN